jgi:CIC family chloride channel protein
LAFQRVSWQKRFPRLGDTRPARAWKLVFYSILVGVISGFGAILFFYGLEWGKFFFFEYLAGYPVVEPPGEQILQHHLIPNPRPWVLFLIPVIGGLLSGFLVYTFAPEAEGHGTDAMIDAFHNKKGIIRGRIPYIKGLASIITLSTGAARAGKAPSPRWSRLRLLAGAGAEAG